jgi:heme A synthase
LNASNMPQPVNPLPYLLAVVLALAVVILGAYTRLSDAGLGCPDWPGCYGHLTVPSHPEAVAQANEAYGHRPVDAGKAWKEMVHRYAAGLLGVLVLGLAVRAWRQGADRLLVTATLVLVLFQAALGMWTVTLLLKPVIVMAHLLGGFTVLSLLWLGYLNARSFVPQRRSPPIVLRRLAPWRCWCCRSRSVAGPVPTMPRWPVRPSPSAWASGGRRWTWPTALSCGGGWASTMSSACWTARRVSRCTWHTGPGPWLRYCAWAVWPC